MDINNPQFQLEIAQRFQSALANHDIVTAIRTDNGIYLEQIVGQQHVLGLTSMLQSIRDEPHRINQIIEDRARRHLEFLRNPPPTTLTAAELKRQLRTRLQPKDGVYASDLFTYAPAFSPDVIQVLNLDLTDHVDQLTAADVKDQVSVMDLETMYRVGQDNVDAEPIEFHEVLNNGVHLVRGRSQFVAAKAANLPSLLNLLQIAAPAGTCFIIPHHHAVAFLPVNPHHPEASLERMQAVLGHALTAWADDAVGGFLSRDVFYYSPRRTVTAISRTIVGAHEGGKQPVYHVSLDSTWTSQLPRPATAAPPKAPSAPAPPPPQRKQGLFARLFTR